MKTRYLFPLWSGEPYLNAYSVLEARIGSLRLLVPSSTSYAIHLLAIIAVALGYPSIFILAASTPFYQQAAPWRYPGFDLAIVLGFVVGFFILLFWEERSIPNWTLRLTSRNPRRHKQVQPIAIHQGLFFQELYATIDDQEVLLRIEGSHKNVLNALTLARISVPARPARRGTASILTQRQRTTPFRLLPRRFSQTSINTGAIAALLLIGSLLSLYVWYLIQDPFNWIWILATVLFGWLTIVIVRVSLRGKRFYCYKCDGYELFFRKADGWRCNRCGEASAL